MPEKMMLKKKSFSLFFILIIIAPLVLGLGVSPSRVVLKFEPNYVYENKLCYTIHRYPTVKLMTDGEFKDRITFPDIDVNQVQNINDVGCIRYQFKMPPALERPGLHYTKIVATEAPDAAEGSITTTVSIEHQIHLFVPYPGKYIEINSFVASNVAAGDPVRMQADIVNKGTDTVSTVSGTIKVYDRTDNLIGTINTNTIQNLAPDELKYLVASWGSGDFKADNYKAYLEVTYDSGVNNATATFKLGGLDVMLTDYTREFEVGQGFKEFSATADSIWSQTIEKVRIVVNVYNYSSGPEPITTVETVSRDIPAWGTEKLTGFIDMNNLKIGNYSLKMKLYFKDPEVADKDKQKDYEGVLTIKAPPPPPEPPKKTFGQVLKGIFTTQVLLIMFGALVLIVLAILVYLLIPKRKKERENPKK